MKKKENLEQFLPKNRITSLHEIQQKMIEEKRVDTENASRFARSNNPYGMSKDFEKFVMSSVD